MIIDSDPTSAVAVRIEPSSFSLNEADTVVFEVTQGGLPLSSKPTWTVEPSWAARVLPEGVLIAQSQADPVRVTVSVGQNRAISTGKIRARPALMESASQTLVAGFAGVPLRDSLAVQILSESGKAVGGVPVSFEVTSGSGQLSHSTRLSSPDGSARVAWTLGAEVGMQSVRASSEGLGQITFEADVRPDLESVAPTILEGAVQTAPAGTVLPTPLTVQVSDSLGNTLVGVPMIWTFSGGGGYVVDNTPVPVDTIRTFTDELGRSSVRWKLGAQVGQQQAAARVEVPAAASAAGGFGGSLASSPPRAFFLADAQPATVAALNLYPGAATVPVRGALAFSVEPTDQFGNPASGVAVQWSTGDPSVATINSSGQLTAVGPGATVVVVRGAGLEEVANVLVVGDVENINIASGNGQAGTVGRALAQPIRVRVTTGAGTPIAGRAVTWAAVAGNGSVVPVSSVTDAQGYTESTWTLGTQPGTQQAQCSVAGVGSVLFNSTAAVGPVHSVVVAPTSLSARVGVNVQFTGTARDEYGNAIGAPLAWTSSTPTVASVSATGQATTLALGVTTIQAELGGLAATATLTVSATAPPPPPPPPPPTGPPGAVTNLSVVSVTENSVTLQWTEVGDGTGGVAKYALRRGTPTISWASAAATEVSVSGSTVGATKQYTWTGLSRGRPYQFMLVSYRGILGGGAVLGPLSNVASATTATIQLSQAAGDGQSAAVGQTLAAPIRVRVTTGTGTPLEGRTVNWSVVSGGGSVRDGTTTTNFNGYTETIWTMGTQPGSAVARATVSGAGSVDFTATASGGGVAAVTVTPSSAGIQVNGSQQFTASATDQFGNPVSGVTFTWASSNPGIASVSATGLASGLAVGTAQITARAGQIQGTAAVTVTTGTPPPPVVNPQTVTTLAVQSATQTSVTVRWTQVDDGRGLPARYAIRYGTPTIDWGPATPTERLVEGTAIGQTITYTYTGLTPARPYQFRVVSYRGTQGVDAVYGGLSNIASGSTTSTVSTQDPEVLISPASVAFTSLTETRQLSAVAHDSAGATVAGAPITWRSLNPSVVSVNASGLITALARGTVQVVASTPCCGADTITVTVTQVPASVTVSPTAITGLSVGASWQFNATVKDARGFAISDASVTWSSANPSIATVSGTGRATAVGAGTTQIRATSGGSSGTALFGASAPPPPAGEAAIFADGFESGDLSKAMNGSKWGHSVRTSVSSAIAHSGQYSLRFSYEAAASGQDSFSEQRYLLGRTNTEFWVRFWIYFPDGTEGVGPRYVHRDEGPIPDNNKFFKIWGGDSYFLPNQLGTSTRKRYQHPGDARIHLEYGKGEGPIGEWGAGGYQDFITNSERGRWVEYKMYGKFATGPDANNGKAKIWWDGRVIAEWTNLDLWSSQANFWDRGYLLGWSASGFAQETYVYIDDIAWYDSNPGW